MSSDTVSPAVPPAAPVLPETLPPLRDDLHLHEAAAHPDGAPSWTIQDPVNNIFYRVGWLEFELLSRWHLGSPTDVLAAAEAETLLKPTEDELLELLLFLQQNHLLALHGPRFTEHLVEVYRRAKLSRANWLLHHYLFFRISLWHPDLWLRRALPWVDWIFHRSTAYAVIALAVLALILTGRQIDVFAASFVDTLSPGGLIGYLLALAVTKSLHELGHAFTATRLGVRVAHMGVAFLVLWPMLYTDTGESWRLRHRHQRLAIASAGILTELALAALATLVWNLVEPGDLRQSLFFLATTAWLLSLGLNASPFMRFDGYFILSDLLDMPNLHERSFALARTWMRNLVLGWDDAAPEQFSPGRRRFLITFALLTWFYRLVIFTSIALAVYFIFFKLLGIFLFLVEIAWFVVRPVANELKIWNQRKSEIQSSRARVFALGLGSLFLIALIPWNLSVTAEAWAHGESAHVIYSPLPARVESIAAAAGAVEQNALLIALEYPESELRARVAVAGSDALQLQLAGLGAIPAGEEKRISLEQQQSMKLAQAGAEHEEQARLRLRAPVAGILTDLDQELKGGVWVSPLQVLGVVIAPDKWAVEAFVTQQDRPRIAAGDRVRFYPADDSLFPLRGRVIEVDHQRLVSLPHPLLSSRYGGSLAVLPDERGMTPRDSLYRVRIHLDEVPDRLAVRQGVVVVDAAPLSWFVQAAKSVLVVLIREASF